MATGIQIEGSRDSGSWYIEYFAIVPNLLEQAIDELIKQMGQAEIALNNDQDKVGEGITSICRVKAGFEIQDGGHGWQGERVLVDESGVRARISELAPLSTGGHWSKQGTIRWYRKR